MSFILDALKKSETERQQRGNAEFSSVPMRSESSRPPVWLWLLAALLLVNLIVLAGLLLRSPGERLAAEPASLDASPQAAMTPAAPPQALPSAVSQEASTAPATTGAAESQDLTPATEQPTARLAAVSQAEGEVRPTATDTTARQRPAQNLPDIDQLRADGLLPLGELRLDIHVYSDVPADRFVFINMVKHREGSTTADGLSVETITPDGVVLDYRGRRFLLPRQ